MEYQGYIHNPYFNLTGCHRDADLPSGAWMAYDFGFPGWGQVVFGQLAQNATPLQKIYGLDSPQDLVIVGSGNSKRMYVSETQAGSGKCLIQRFDLSSLPAPGTDAFASWTAVKSPDTELLEVDGPAGQLALVGDWLLFAAASSIHGYNLLQPGSNPVEVVSGIVGGTRSLIARSSGDNQVTIFFIHGGNLKRLELALSDQALSTDAGTLANFNADPLPAGPKGQMVLFDEQLLLPIATVGGSTIIRVRDDGSFVEDQLQGFPPQAVPNTAMRSICHNGDGKFLLVSDSGYGSFSYGLPEDNLAMGVGFVPFDRIIQEPGPDQGRADTTADPGYFFQVDKAPFGGSIHLIISHKVALQANIASYKVALGGVEILSGFWDYKWDPVVKAWYLVMIAPGANGYPIRDVVNEQWYSPTRGAIINTGLVDNGLQELELSFYDADANLVESASVFLLIDNENSTASLEYPVIGGNQPALQCGCLSYTSKTDNFEVSFIATHPHDEGSYKLNFYRGGKHLPSPISETGPVQVGPQVKAGLTVQDILGTCNVANIRIDLSVPTRITDGYKWIYGSHAQRNFTLVPNTVQLEG